MCNLDLWCCFMFFFYFVDCLSSKHRIIEKCRNFFGYINTKSLEEIEKVIFKETELMNKNFADFANRKIEITKELSLIWEKLMQSLSE